MQSFGIVHQHDIEAARRHVMQSGQIKLCGVDQSFLLMPVHACCGTPEVGIAALSDLNENQRVLILHDQVDLTQTAAKILRDQPQALLLQKFRRPALSLFSVQG